MQNERKLDLCGRVSYPGQRKFRPSSSLSKASQLIVLLFPSVAKNLLPKSFFELLKMKLPIGTVVCWRTQENFDMPAIVRKTVKAVETGPDMVFLESFDKYILPTKAAGEWIKTLDAHPYHPELMERFLVEEKHPFYARQKRAFEKANSVCRAELHATDLAGEDGEVDEEDEEDVIIKRRSRRAKRWRFRSEKTVEADPHISIGERDDTDVGSGRKAFALNRETANPRDSYENTALHISSAASSLSHERELVKVFKRVYESDLEWSPARIRKMSRKTSSEGGFIPFGGISDDNTDQVTGDTRKEEKRTGRRKQPKPLRWGKAIVHGL